MKLDNFNIKYLLTVVAVVAVIGCTDNQNQEREVGDQLHTTEVNAESESADWTLAESNDGRFSIEFPQKSWDEGVDQFDLQGRLVDVNFYMITLDGEQSTNLAYRADYAKLPWITDETQVDSLFQAQIAFVNSMEQIQVLSKIELPVKHNGIELEIGVEGGDVITTYQLHFSNGIFYKLMVVTGKESHPNDLAYNFFDTFHINPG